MNDTKIKYLQIDSLKKVIIKDNGKLANGKTRLFEKAGLFENESNSL